MVRDMKKVIKFFRNHAVPALLLKIYSKQDPDMGAELSLITVCATRFRSAVYAAERMLKLRDVLRKITRDRRFTVSERCVVNSKNAPCCGM